MMLTMRRASYALLISSALNMAVLTPGVATPVTESEQKDSSAVVPEVVVTASAQASQEQEIRDFVREARMLLDDVDLKYVLERKRGREVLRGRPVAFALWNERDETWHIVLLEISVPTPKWIPGGKPITFRLLSPGFTAQHVKGVGAERLMFSFEKDGVPLRVYGRKFPVFDGKLIAKRRWRDVVATAQAITYLPFTEDVLDPAIIASGQQYLSSTAIRAIGDLHKAGVPSRAFPGKLISEIVPPQVLATLAVIEQTDDFDFVNKMELAIDEVLNHYGLKREEAYRYSISAADAIGPMQFTNRRGNGTYALVVRMCEGAKIDPDFERGAVDLHNAMKAAACLFDIELSQMDREIRHAYMTNMEVLGIFPVAAYNGGPKNVEKLSREMERLGVRIEMLREVPDDPPLTAVDCPCLWHEHKGAVRPVSIPQYNNENRWYIEKYQSILKVFQ